MILHPFIRHTSLIVLMLLISLLVSGCVQESRGMAGTVQPSVNHTVSSTGVPSLTTLAPEGVNVTINSVLRTNLIHGAHPVDRSVFIVVDLTIQNHRKESYPLTPSKVKLNGHQSHNVGMEERLETPISWGPVQSGGARRGEIVFTPWDVAQELELIIYDIDGTVLFKKELNEGPLTGYDTSKSEKLKALMKNTNFTDVIQQLDTPLLAAQYTNERFTYSEISMTLGYSPEKFFIERKGDCCEFSWFLAYVLAAHGYDAHMLSFKYYNKDGEYDGHVVALFADKDGQLKYATIPDLTKFRNASSVDDVLAREKERLEAREIISHLIHQPVSTDTCHYK